ncbi:glycerol dehydrogenase [Gammaproteobacteria bacterium ESL0073]|uniref:Glycerol dehydrogenase n=1 Tax=Entomomonas moraniae TaxID=2213226 RepID=A0A3Q9JHI4_9GAMM|nr:glycerol dehydrogenase [Entomomonas moraniae]AWM80754.1 glycerol dehydrogenase [Gammaproteobacteria bacterium ESL0073]AZS49597.1 glycerol dehydrogenase [Entomomonas moraniae]
MITPRSITSPKAFLIAKGLMDSLETHIKPVGQNALIICDTFFMERINNNVQQHFPKAQVKAHVEKFAGECTKAEVKRLTELCKTNQHDVVIGIGGGKTLDTAKAVAYYQNIPVIIVPTLASTDAPCTALSVFYKENGEFDEYLFLPENPQAVIVDSQVIANAPVRFFAAGVGDALATYFEARMCYLADGVNLVLKRPSRTGLGIAQLCFELLIENAAAAMDAVQNKVVTPALEQTIEATIYLSGVGAESGGLAAAHAVSNGMGTIEALHNAQHGEKVAFGLLTQLVLENAPEDEIETVINIMQTVGLPLSLADFGLKTIVEADWRKVAEVACAEGDTMSNMNQKVTPDDVYAAILAANSLAERYHF